MPHPPTCLYPTHLPTPSACLHPPSLPACSWPQSDVLRQAVMTVHLLEAAAQDLEMQGRAQIRPKSMGGSGGGGGLGSGSRPGSFTGEEVAGSGAGSRQRQRSVSTGSAVGAEAGVAVPGQEGGWPVVPALGAVGRLSSPASPSRQLPPVRVSAGQLSRLQAQQQGGPGTSTAGAGECCWGGGP